MSRRTKELSKILIYFHICTYMNRLSATQSIYSTKESNACYLLKGSLKREYKIFEETEEIMQRSINKQTTNQVWKS